MKYIIQTTLILSLLITATSCKKNRAGKEISDTNPADTTGLSKVSPPEPPLAAIPVTKTVVIGDYFDFLDALVSQYDTLVPYALSEHLLVRANPWIIDTLENTDYYRQMALGNFVYDQKKMAVLHPGDTLFMPGPQTAAALLAKMADTRLDINIPAFQLRIIEGDSVLYAYPVRVGKNRKRYLALIGRRENLRTRTGVGEIVRISRDPLFLDPVTGEKFKYTRRDDRKTTLMPQIPWIEPELDGNRYGQMIHPTTNPVSLGKAASNGCIGMREADAWRVYYHAPIGTKVVVRYDLMEINEKGDTLRYDDVYRFFKHGKTQVNYASAFFFPVLTGNTCVCDP